MSLVVKDVNGVQYTINGITTKINGSEQIKTPYSLSYRQGGTTYYVPLTTTWLYNGNTIKSGSKYWIYNYNYAHNTTQVIKVRVNGTTYTGIGGLYESSYAIPAGTYTPQVFRNMILSFIARGSGTTRAVDRATSVTVNNQTVSLAKGALVRYQYQGTSPFNLDFVTFGRSLGTNEFWKPHMDTVGFTNYKAYCVDSGAAGDGYSFYAYYYKYSITVNTSFNFT